MRSVGLMLVVVVAIDGAACAVQQQPLAATAAASLKGRRVTTTARPPTPFFVIAPGQHLPAPMGGLLGGALQSGRQAEAGTRILRENGVADPALHMARQVSDHLRRRYGLELEPQAIFITDEDPKRITAVHPSADLILDVWITRLSLEPFSPSSSKYRITFAADLRFIDAKVVHLIDGKKGAVIAHGRCVRKPEETPSAPTYDDLLANGARRLIHELDRAAQSCVDKFRSEVLAATTTP